MGCTSTTLIERLLTSTCRPRDHALAQFSFNEVKPQPWRIRERKFAVYRAYGPGKHRILGARIVIIFTRVVSVGECGDEVQAGGVAGWV